MVVLMNEAMIKCFKHLTIIKDSHFSNYGSKKWIDSKLMSYNVEASYARIYYNCTYNYNSSKRVIVSCGHGR